MEKHKCKLCLRKFANGRALGGHVRSHKINLYPPPTKAKLLLQEMTTEEEEEEDIDSCSQSSSSFTSSSNDDDDEFEDEDKGWKENLSHSHLMDRHQEKEESESESSRNHFFTTQSKRIRSPRISGTHQAFFNKDSIFRQPICENERKSDQALESPLMEAAEPLSSSISETTQEEDIAYCLMMLSRDKWTKTEPIKKSESESSETKDRDDQCQEEDGAKKVEKSSRSKGKYRCETCDKVFKSYQALGGHRASHKRIKLTNFASSTTEKKILSSGGGNAVEEVKLHKCPVCFKVFSSGQALGGHKRSHGSSTLRLSSSSGNNYKGLIDLNLPAPIDDEDDIISQVVEQNSALSEDEFVKLH